MTAAPSEIQLRKTKKSAQSAHQKTFQRLTKKIKSLQKDHELLQRELEECLKFYHAQIYPIKNELKSAIKEFVLILHRHYKELKALNRKEREVLKDILENKLNSIYTHTLHTSQDPELAAIYKDLKGDEYEAAVLEELEAMKREMKAQFQKEAGVDIDLSSITAEDTEADMMRKLFEALREAQAEEQETFEERPKTKQERQKEETHELQKREISYVYKQLAKVLHPDLEQDPAQKAVKLELMKQLTTAYDNNDLHALLLLEMKWLDRSKEAAKAQSDDQLKAYNSLLKSQVATLEEELEATLHHPRYQAIHPYISGFAFGGTDTLAYEQRNLCSELASYQSVIKSLKTKRPEKIVQELIQEWFYHNG